MHECGAVVSDGSKTILMLRAQKAVDAIYLTLRCLIVMEPLAKNNELLLPLRDCRQVYYHFEKVFQRTSENAAPPSRSPCRAVPKRIIQCALRSGTTSGCALSAINHSTRVQGPRRGSTSSLRLIMLAIAIVQAAANLVRSIDCTASQMILLIRTFLLCVSQLVRSAQNLIANCNAILGKLLPVLYY